MEYGSEHRKAVCREGTRNAMLATQDRNKTRKEQELELGLNLRQ